VDVPCSVESLSGEDAVRVQSSVAVPQARGAMEGRSGSPLPWLGLATATPLPIPHFH